MGWKHEKMNPSYKCHESVLNKGIQSIDKFLVRPNPAGSADDDGSDENGRLNEVEDDSDDDTIVSGDEGSADNLEVPADGEDRSDDDTMESDMGDEMESEETDVNQNTLCNKRNIDQVDRSSDDDEEPLAINGGEMDVEVTHPTLP